MRQTFCCWIAPSRASQVKSELAAIRGGQGETKESGSHARYVACLISKGIILRLTFGWLQSHQHLALSRLCVLENGSHCGNSRQKFHPKDWKQVKSLQLPMASSQVNQQLCPPAYLLLTMVHNTIVRRGV